MESSLQVSIWIVVPWQAARIMKMDLQADIRTIREFQKYLGRVTMRKDQAVFQ